MLLRRIWKPQPPPPIHKQRRGSPSSSVFLRESGFFLVLRVLFPLLSLDESRKIC